MIFLTNIQSASNFGPQRKNPDFKHFFGVFDAFQNSSSNPSFNVGKKEETDLIVSMQNFNSVLKCFERIRSIFVLKTFQLEK